jgi:hypothetical protein
MKIAARRRFRFTTRARRHHISGDVGDASPQRLGDAGPELVRSSAPLAAAMLAEGKVSGLVI